MSGSINGKTGKRRGGSDSGRGSEERQSSVPAKGTKRGRDNEIEKVRIKNFAKQAYVKLIRLSVSLGGSISFAAINPHHASRQSQSATCGRLGECD